MDPLNHDVLYGRSPRPPAHGVWKSTNAATGAPATFTRTNFPSSSSFRRISLGIGGRGAPGTLYAAVENASGTSLWGFFRTADGGATWAHVDAGANGDGTLTNITISGTTYGLFARVTGPPFVADGTWEGRRILVGPGNAATVLEVLDADSMLISLRFTAPPPTPVHSAIRSVTTRATATGSASTT